MGCTSPVYGIDVRRSKKKASSAASVSSKWLINFASGPEKRSTQRWHHCGQRDRLTGKRVELLCWHLSQMSQTHFVEERCSAPSVGRMPVCRLARSGHEGQRPGRKSSASQVLPNAILGSNFAIISLYLRQLLSNVCFTPKSGHRD